MMKIVFLYPNLTGLAGTERVIVEKANYLSEEPNYEVVILTYEHGSHPIAYPLSPNVRHIDFNICFHSLYRYHRIRRFYKKIKRTKELQKRFNQFMYEFRPDIVVTVTYYVDALRVITKCPVKCKRILESHVDKRFLLANDPTQKKDIVTRLRLFYESWGVDHYAGKFDLLVALTQDDADNWSRLLKTKVITNIVHINKDGKYSSLNNKRVIFAGRYAPEKGLFDLFKIWEIVNRKHSDWRLDLYGTGALKDVLVEKARSLNINIHINPPCNNILEEYQNSSIFVLCSVFEAFGLVIPEAMSCGLPVISFDCPFGPRHIITNGVDGFLIANRDIQEFANRICELIESEHLRHQIGQRAIQSANNFSTDKIIPQWTSLYNSLIQ